MKPQYILDLASSILIGCHYVILEIKLFVYPSIHQSFQSLFMLFLVQNQLRCGPDLCRLVKGLAMLRVGVNQWRR